MDEKLIVKELYEYELRHSRGKMATRLKNAVESDAYISPKPFTRVMIV